jgi:glycosyltransferase involved in cell wall biosynthesis
MQRICTSLAAAGHKVTLVGRQNKGSLALQQQPYEQVRLIVKHEKGKLFYLSFNWKLYQWLKKRPTSENSMKTAICAIDLDTIVPCYYASLQNGWLRVYDAHELFTEQYEVKRRPWIAAIWRWVERYFVPKFPNGYTVNQLIADEFARRYRVEYPVIRNMPLAASHLQQTVENEWPWLPKQFFLYQGAVNEGRGFDELLEAMEQVAWPLVIVGGGNYFEKVQAFVAQKGLQQQVILAGYIAPDSLRRLTPKALAGITIFNKEGLNQFHSLANRFFDYVQAGIPQICVGYPAYRQLNLDFEVALLVNDIMPNTLASALNKLASDAVLQNKLTQNSRQAAKVWNWENESRQLLQFWQDLADGHQ